jgi:hypothetical protein
MMKYEIRRWNVWLGSAGAAIIVGMLLLAGLRGRGQTAAVLQISSLPSNQILITISNGGPGLGFDIQRRLAFEPGYDWITIPGTNSQTNFVVDKGIDMTGFFRAVSCGDCDGDGIPNWADPQPTNPAVSNLVVTIDTPANGATVP